MTLYRGMKRNGSLPATGVRQGLHIRPGVDVPALEDSDLVEPGDGGLSTTPDEPLLLPNFSRPESLGGTSKHPVWSIERGELPAHRLASRWDNKKHETVMPRESMTLGEFESHIHSTAAEWELAYE